MAGRSTKLQASDGVRSLDAEEREAVRDAFENVLTAPLEGYVRLFNPLYADLKYGPGSAPLGAGTGPDLIVFGEFEPHVARVPQNHTLLEGMLRRHPEIRIVEDEQVKVYACALCEADGLDATFNTRQAFLNHARVKHIPSGVEREVLDPRVEVAAQQADAQHPPTAAAIDPDISALDPAQLTGDLVPVGESVPSRVRVQQGARRAAVQKE